MTESIYVFMCPRCESMFRNPPTICPNCKRENQLKDFRVFSEIKNPSLMSQVSGSGNTQKGGELSFTTPETLDNNEIDEGGNFGG